MSSPASLELAKLRESLKRRTPSAPECAVCKALTPTLVAIEARLDALAATATQPPASDGDSSSLRNFIAEQLALTPGDTVVSRECERLVRENETLRATISALEKRLRALPTTE